MAPKRSNEKSRQCVNFAGSKHFADFFGINANLASTQIYSPPPPPHSFLWGKNDVANFYWGQKMDDFEFYIKIK
jgi:hypothetical protein